MPKAKKKKESIALEFQLPSGPGKEKNYFLFSGDGDSSSAKFTKGNVTITHHETASFTITDTENGYEIVEKSPGGGTKKYSIDYGTMADLIAAFRIFRHDNHKLYGDYWTVYEGEKL